MGDWHPDSSNNWVLTNQLRQRGRDFTWMEAVQVEISSAIFFIGINRDFMGPKGAAWRNHDQNPWSPWSKHLRVSEVMDHGDHSDHALFQAFLDRPTVLSISHVCNTKNSCAWVSHRLLREMVILCYINKLNNNILNPKLNLWIEYCYIMFYWQIE